MPRTDIAAADIAAADIAAADIDLTAMILAHGIAGFNLKRCMDDSWYFEVRLLGQVFPGYGDTFGAALADAKARNAERLAA